MQWVELSRIHSRTQAAGAIKDLEELLPGMTDNTKVLSENKILKKKLKDKEDEVDSLKQALTGLKKTLGSLAGGST